MDIFGKINPLAGDYDHSTFQETLEALLREGFEDIGIVSVGKGNPSESHTAELRLEVAEFLAETTKVMGDALQELFGQSFSFSFNGTDLLVERAGFNSKIDAFVELRLEWRENAVTKAQHDAEQHDTWLHRPYEGTGEDMAVIDYNYAD